MPMAILKPLNNDPTKVKAFGFTLEHEATKWFRILEPEAKETYDDLKQSFLIAYANWCQVEFSKPT